MKDLIIVHDPHYENWVFEPLHPTQGRRFVLGFSQTLMLADAEDIDVDVIAPSTDHSFLESLSAVHDEIYIQRVMREGLSDEWVGPRVDLGQLAFLFAQGTFDALRALIHGDALTTANLPGAKHHAMRDHSSGFCVFNDFAACANYLSHMGLRVAIFDLDAHHGDGVEELTRFDKNILTYSIHQLGIFPFTGFESKAELHVYNYGLGAASGDRELMTATADFCDVASRFNPNFIFITGGADGHVSDPLSNLMYSFNGMEESMHIIRHRFPDHPILFGGAGGYRPDNATPIAWSRMLTALSRT